ncbi:MAG: ribosome biogenesis GTPase YlqF, partial [Oscillospiraceae bacterium]
INDGILDIEEIACTLLEQVKKACPKALKERYKLTDEQLEQSTAYELLCTVGKNRGMLVSGGEVNTERAAVMVCDEFRASKLGRISLEKPNFKVDL